MIHMKLNGFLYSIFSTVPIFPLDSDIELYFFFYLQLKFLDRQMLITLMKIRVSKRMLAQLHQLLCY